MFKKPTIICAAIFAVLNLSACGSNANDAQVTATDQQLTTSESSTESSTESSADSSTESESEESTSTDASTSNAPVVYNEFPGRALTWGTDLIVEGSPSRGFTTPSGNISCIVSAKDKPGNNTLACNVLSWGEKLPVVTGNIGHDPTFYGVYMNLNGSVYGAPATITHKDSNDWVVPYGSVLKDNGFTCQVEEAGVTCTVDATGVGAFFNRDRFDRIG